MKKYPLLYTAFFLIIILGVLQQIATWQYLYWTLWWFDGLMHFLGGFSLGFIALFIFYELNFFRARMSLSKIFLTCFVFVMILSGIWEIFEYVNDLTQSTEGYRLDVVNDLLADALGVIVAILITKRFQ